MALRFQVAGFPVRIHPLFFLTTLATGATGWRSPGRLAVWFLVVLISVLIHELGHALAFRRCGHGATIALHGMGGTATSTGGKALTHRQHLGISLAGPGAGFLLGGLVLALQHLTPVGQTFGLGRFTVSALLWVNFGWGLINLLPILPLDGGHAMAAAIRARGGNRYEWLIHALSLVTAAGGLVLSIIWKELWLGMFALVLGVLNVGRFTQAWAERRYMLQLRAASKRGRPSIERLEAERAPPPDPPLDPRFLGEWLLDNGLAELALPPLRAAFTEKPTPRTGHALATALLEVGRYAEVARLLSEPGVTHLGDETLTLIARRAEAAAQPSLATRARELHQARASARAPRA